VGHQYSDAVRIATRDEGDPAALVGVDTAAVFSESPFQHMKIVCAVDRPDQVLRADPAGEMRRSGAVPDQVDLEAS
jgi:hypothetical protein